MGKKNKFETNAIHIGNEPDLSTGSISPPINLTSTYVQEGIGKNKGYDYSRGNNPTRQRLEKNIASLEMVRCAQVHGCMFAMNESCVCL